MWVTPRMTDIFILKEFRKLKWLTARLQTWGGRRDGCHAGGRPPARITLTHLFVPFQAAAQSVPCPPLGGSRGDWLKAQTTQAQPQLFLTG